MSTFATFYKKPAIISLVALALGAFVGYHQMGTVGAALGSLLTVALLSILEVSVSFDNAVLNAKELEHMSEKHRNWFMVWGILVAVVGMRLLFPVLIVSAIGGMNPIASFLLALTEPSQYSNILATSNDYVSAFGGAFLMMVVLNFFLDKEKDSHWIPFIEAPLTKLAQLEVVLTLGAVILTSFEVEAARQYIFVIAGILGVALNLGVTALKSFLEDHNPMVASGVGTAVKAGIASLIYLEILDASMSFDGVIGAFAITTNIFLVMLGLGVGAMFVRSMTLHLVEKKTIAEYRYLEHGALWAIGVLSAIMFFKVKHDVPEVFTGLVSAFIIGVAVLHSHILNKNDAKREAEESTLVDYKPEAI